MNTTRQTFFLALMLATGSSWGESFIRLACTYETVEEIGGKFINKADDIKLISISLNDNSKISMNIQGGYILQGEATEAEFRATTVKPLSKDFMVEETFTINRYTGRFEASTRKAGKNVGFRYQGICRETSKKF